MNATSVGRTVLWARKRAGMTQHGLAKATDIPQPSIARIERGTVIPRTATLIKLLAATGHQLIVEPSDAAVDREAIRGRLAMPLPRRTRVALGKGAGDHRTSPVQILRRLRRFGVPFVLIGELAEAVHGAPTDVDGLVEVCRAQSDVAMQRLSNAVEDLRATPSDGGEHMTDAGRLRIVTVTSAGDDYDMLVRNAVQMHVDAGILVQVAALEDLIRLRRASIAAEDRHAAAVLQAIANELDDR